MKLWRLLVLLLGLFLIGGVLLVGFNFLVMPRLIHRNTVVVLPDLRGQSLADAALVARDMDLRIKPSRQRAHPTVARGLILDQIPAADAPIRRGRTVRVVISSGTPAGILPDLRGLAQRQAEVTLQRETFQLGRVLRIRRNQATGPTVAYQYPPAGIERHKGQVVDVVIAEPPLPATYRMPNLRGISLFAARAEIMAAGCVTAPVAYESRPNITPNMIISQRPRAGRASRRERWLNWWRRHAESRVAVAPSVLAADFADLRHEIASVEAAGADLLHMDIMDGHFVPNLTFGPFIAAAIRRCSTRPLDAHLMISRPDRYLEAFARSGVAALTIHVEAEVEIAATLAAIKAQGLRRGLSFRPATGVASLRPYLQDLDLVLVMAVEPGFGGQSFQDAALAKIRELVSLRDSEGYSYVISVDGGVDDGTAGGCRRAGADILVSGTFVFGAADRVAAIGSLRGAGMGEEVD